jgi:pyruvate formate lyase activating enzyme
MPYAQLVSTLPDGRLRCEACQWRCVREIADAEDGAAALGLCQVRRWTESGIELLNDSLISGATVGPVEDQRLYHFFPDTLALALGSWGYAFPADQKRGSYARIPDGEQARRRLDPARIARFALERLCRGVIWAYGEPAVAHEYVLQVLQLSRSSSRYTALLSTCFMTIEALDAYGPYLHGLLLDLRAFDDAAYERLTGVRDWRGILDVARQAKERHGCHIEVLTRLHPGVNDTPAQLLPLIGWLRESLGAATPWHLLPGDAGAEAAASVGRARRLAFENGLAFVYGPEPNQQTRCPACGAVVIERQGGQTRLLAVDAGRCAACQTDLNLRLSIFG